MKINLLHITFDMRIGGTEQVIKNLVQSTDKSKYNISVLCLEAPIGPFGKMLSDLGYKIDTLPRKEGFDLKLIFQVRKYLIRNKIDILHCHQYTPWVYGVLASLGRWTRTKVIFTEHGRFYPDRSSIKRRFINPLLALLTNKITVISQATKQALVDYEYLKEKDIQVIYNGIHRILVDNNETNKLRKKLGIPSHKIILGTIARLDSIKNHKMMLNAFSKVLENIPDTVLIIVGDGDERNNLEHQSQNLNINKQVLFTGYESNPHTFLNLMDIYLLSSFSEGTSMTLLEAMALSKPCVVTDAGGNPEIIKNKLNGLVTGNDKTQEFTKAIETLIIDAPLREQMASDAKKRFEKLFTDTIMSENYQSLYQTLL